MGGNVENPEVNVLADTTNEGVAPESKEEPASTVVAQDALGLYENQLAILKRDNEQLRDRDLATTAKMRELWNLLETPDGLNVEERVKTWKEERQAAQERIGALQIALGIGPGDDPEAAAGALKARNRLADVDPTSTLPAYGHLLLMTSLARLSPTLRPFYNSVPTQFRAPNGDAWSARVEETYDADQQPIRNVVIRLEADAFARQEAKIRLQHLESQFAAAIRANTIAKKRLDVSKDSPDATIRERAESEMKDAQKRGKEIQAELERIKPLAANPEVEEWRFSADLDEYSLRGAA